MQRSTMGNSQNTLHHFFNEKEVKQFAVIYNEKGFCALVSCIKEKLVDLEHQTLHIAITGESSTGKSALINAMRGLRSGEPGAAEEGSLEQIQVPMAYQHPTLPFVCFWELPSIGTSNLPTNKYSEIVNLNNYDFFIIVTGNRFKENDGFLAKEIGKTGKQFYFVRSKMDIEIDILKKQNRLGEREKEFDKIRESCTRSLENDGFPSSKVFLVSSYYVDDFEFCRLSDALKSEMNAIKKHVFFLSLPQFITAVIKKKKSVLHRLIIAAAFASVTAWVAPLPGPSLVYDVCILVGIFGYMRQNYGLNEKSLKGLAARTGKPVKVLKTKDKKSVMSNITIISAATLTIGLAAAAIKVSNEVFHVIPTLSPIVGGSLSFLSTYCILKNVLDDFARSAVQVIMKAFES
ncbi:interferon-inducible GTPase 5-like isoform X1 [Polypterus senegalus]|uniref:interferon-inducible GTPase 5-like isoform X1 n=1 Tax=Polypterus senegalus TaxID=55291 RepID=UPI00196560BF|nr:interferon-inducible GTPase 5-like isoform X1 [Polypterus senegalus]